MARAVFSITKSTRVDKKLYYRVLSLVESIRGATLIED
jgi:hypothetical protein